jgi:hypothetical protein
MDRDRMIYCEIMASFIYLLIGLGFYLIPPFFGKRLRLFSYGNGLTPVVDSILFWPFFAMFGILWIPYKALEYVHNKLKSFEVKTYTKNSKE